MRFFVAYRHVYTGPVLEIQSFRISRKYLINVSWTSPPGWKQPHSFHQRESFHTMKRRVLFKKIYSVQYSVVINKLNAQEKYIKIHFSLEEEEGGEGRRRLITPFDIVTNKITICSTTLHIVARSLLLFFLPSLFHSIFIFMRWLELSSYRRDFLRFWSIQIFYEGQHAIVWLKMLSYVCIIPAKYLFNIL